MAAPVRRRPPKTAASVLAFAMARRGLGEPPPDETLVGWLRNRSHRLAWVVCNRPKEAIALGLIDQPLPQVILDLRHSCLPLDPRSEVALRAALSLAGVTRQDLELALADRSHLLQSALLLLEAKQ